LVVLDSTVRISIGSISMTIITISRGSYSKGKVIAELVSAKLGYECVGRDILIETSEHFHIPEMKLIRAIHDAPSILDRLGYKKERYLAFIENAFLHHVKDASVVYHGLAGHVFLKGVSHVLKVRIIADMEDRIKLEMEREKISAKEAAAVLRKDDEERRKWSRYLYGIDPSDPSLYDLVIHIRKITPEMATNLICDTAASPLFKHTDASMKAMQDLYLASKVKVALIQQVPLVGVTADGGVVHVTTRGHLSREGEINASVTEIVKTVPGVEKVLVEVSSGTVTGK
jgi:cytidylate kinase